MIVVVVVCIDFFSCLYIVGMCIIWSHSLYFVLTKVAVKATETLTEVNTIDVVWPNLQKKFKIIKPTIVVVVCLTRIGNGTETHVHRLRADHR